MALKPATPKVGYGFCFPGEKSGINAKIVSLDQYRLNDLSKKNTFYYYQHAR